MVKRFIIILNLLLLGGYFTIKAQDAHFSQFYANSLYLNPAFAGSEKCPRFSFNYRNQWPAYGSTFSTFSASYDQHLNAIQGGIGIHVLNDVQGENGAIKTNQISGMYSYTLPVTRNFFISAGFQATFVTKSVNWEFVFPDMIHPLYGPIYETLESQSKFNEQRNYVDFSTGMIAYTDKIFLGLAFHHLTQPSESFLIGSDAILPLKISAHFGTEIPINSNRYRNGELTIAPQLLFHQQGKFQQFNWGLYLSRKKLVTGFWLRQNFNFHYDSFIMLVGFKQDNLRFAYSYDFTVSALSNSTLGAHEVSVAFVLPCRVKNKKLTTISCPSF